MDKKLNDMYTKIEDAKFAKTSINYVLDREKDCLPKELVTGLSSSNKLLDNWIEDLEEQVKNRRLQGYGSL